MRSVAAAITALILVLSLGPRPVAAVPDLTVCSNGQYPYSASMGGIENIVEVKPGEWIRWTLEGRYISPVTLYEGPTLERFGVALWNLRPGAYSLYYERYVPPEGDQSLPWSEHETYNCTVLGSSTPAGKFGFDFSTVGTPKFPSSYRGTSAGATATATPKPRATVSPTKAPAATPKPTPVPTPTPSPTPAPTATPSPTPAPTATPSATPAPTPSPASTPGATATQSPEPVIAGEATTGAPPILPLVAGVAALAFLLGWVLSLRRVRRRG